jgi:hypothetical protein
MMMGYTIHLNADFIQLGTENSGALYLPRARMDGNEEGHS